jgi:hypothetical protein
VATTNVIAVANEQVPIVTVCQMVGVELPDDVAVGRSRKVHCPFGELYHSDSGIEATMRVYPDSNSAYCFSCSAYYTPVSLAAKAMDVDRQTAARLLLDRIGYRPLSLAAVWKQVSAYEPALDRSMLAEALKTFCRRIEPAWSRRQFDADVAATLTRCLSLLDLVVTADDASLWLNSCKTVMASNLETRPSAS